MNNYKKRISANLRDLLICLFLAAATLLVYYQVHQFEFVNYDDDYYVTENRYVQAGITNDSIEFAMLAAHAGNWHPITWLSHMLDCQLFGMDPGRHHLSSLLFHIASTLLLYIIFRKTTGNAWQSGFVAALFALHPIHVESVAWISERKDVLSTFFAMLTLASYFWYSRRPSIERYMLVMLCFTLGLMSKPMVVTLPFVLLLMDFWPLYRFRFQAAPAPALPTDTAHKKSSVLYLVFEKIPLFALAALSSFVTFHAQDYGGAVATLDAFPVSARISNAIVSYVSYLIKTVYPVNLAVPYPHPGIMPLWIITGACLLLAFISYPAIRTIRQQPYFIVGWLWFLGTLVPVIGLVQVGSQAMADRYSYVPLIGIFIIIAWGVPELLKKWQHQRLFLTTSVPVLVAVLMVLTWKQAGYWKNSIALFSHSIEVTSGNFIAHNNLGNALNRKGFTKEAVYHYSQAIEIKPWFEEAHFNLATVLEKQGKTDDAIHYYNEAIRIYPYYEEAHNNLGALLNKQGKTDEAISHYQEAIRINPDYEKAHNNLGTVLSKQGRHKEAMHHFKKALSLNPDNEKAHYNLAKAFTRLKRADDAIKHYKKAIMIKPDLKEAHYNLATTLQKQGRVNEAITHYQQAIKIKPDFEKAHFNLGIALLRKGDIDGAITGFENAIQIKPDYMKAKILLKKALALKQKKTEIQ